jgi:hypothetical protein
MGISPFSFVVYPTIPFPTEKEKRNLLPGRGPRLDRGGRIAYDKDTTRMNGYKT